MATNFLTKIFGSRNDRLLKQYRSVVARINGMEAGLEKLTDEQLKAKTQEFRDRVTNGEALDALLPEAFAVVREGYNRPNKREDQLDRVYKTTREKYEAAIKDIRECYDRGQP